MRIAARQDDVLQDWRFGHANARELLRLRRWGTD